MAISLRHNIKTSLRAIKTNRSRSTLTILGIVIGVASIIVLMSLGAGAQNLILEQIRGLGSRTIVVIPGREPRGPSEFAQTFSDSLKERDLDALGRNENVPAAGRILPLVFGGETASFENETYRITLLGASGLAPDIFELYPEEGTFFGEDEVRSKSDVIVIGAKVKKELYGESNALGSKIKIKGRGFRVVGVLPEKGQVSFFNFDDSAIIPYTNAQQYIFGIKYFNRIIVETASETRIQEAVDDIKTTIRHSHNITDPEKDDFFVQTQADIAARIGNVTAVLTLFLVSIAAISLIVGGIGIMNIMLVSVTERTKEIGLRKAVGATNSDILLQFLLEAVLLTSIGGIAGIILGGIIAFMAALVLSQIVGLNWNYDFPIVASIIGLAVSVSVGLFFGLYPARQASLKNPIDALHYE